MPKVTILTERELRRCVGIDETALSVVSDAELHHAIEAGAVAEDHPEIELGEVISGAKAGRGSAEAVTLCELTGTGVQDTAIALHAYRKAAGLGSVIET